MTVAAVVGFHKQVAHSLIATWLAALAAPAGSPSAPWTDDAGQSRSLLCRGAWSADAPIYPQVEVGVELPDDKPKAIGRIITRGLAQDGVTVTVPGGWYEGVRLHGVIQAASRDELYQLTDLLTTTLEGGYNSVGVPWLHVLKGYGVEVYGSERDRFTTGRQQQDPSHAPVAFANDKVWVARVHYHYIVTTTKVKTITLTRTLTYNADTVPPWAFGQ